MQDQRRTFSVLPGALCLLDPDRLVDRLQELGEVIGRRDEALRFLLGVMADGPQSGPPPEQTVPDEALARQCLQAGLLFSQAGQWTEAGSMLGNAMSAAPAGLKGEVAAALDAAAPHSEVAAANLAMALLLGDGLPRDVGRARALLAPLVRSDVVELRAHAHNWLAHIAAGDFGGRSMPAAALFHFEQAAEAGHGEAAFNAGVVYDEGDEVPALVGKARDLYRRGAELGHVQSMTNLAIKVMEHDPDEAVTLLEQAADAGDGKAEALLQAVTESGMARAVAGDLEEDADGTLPPVRVVSSGAWRPKALAAALREGAGASAKEAEELVAFMLGFGSWRELARAAAKGNPDRPDEECGAEEVGRRRAYQAQVLASCSDMGPLAASIAVEALRPSAKAGRPVLDAGTLIRMQEASDAYAEAQDEEELAGLADLVDDEELAEALDGLMHEVGIDPQGDVGGLLDEIRRMQPIQPDVWLGIMQEHLGWSFTAIDEDAERDGEQVAVAVGAAGRRLPVIMSTLTTIPGDLGVEQVARLKARIGAAHPAGGCDNEYRLSGADEFWLTPRGVTGWAGPRPGPAG